MVPESAELLFPHAVRPPTSDVTANTAAAILLIFMSLRSPWYRVWFVPCVWMLRLLIVHIDLVRPLRSGGMPAVFANNVQRNARFHAVLAIASNRAIADIYMPLSCAYAARPANARPGGAEATTGLTY